MHAGPRMPVLSVSRFNSTAVCTIELHQPMLSLPCTVYRHTPQLTFVEMNTMWLCSSTVACMHDTLACMVVHGKAHGGVCMAACASQWRPHVCIATAFAHTLIIHHQHSSHQSTSSQSFFFFFFFLSPSSSSSSQTSCPFLPNPIYIRRC